MTPNQFGSKMEEYVIKALDKKWGIKAAKCKDKGNTLYDVDILMSPTRPWQAYSDGISVKTLLRGVNEDENGRYYEVPSLKNDKPDFWFKWRKLESMKRAGYACLVIGDKAHIFNMKAFSNYMMGLAEDTGRHIVRENKTGMYQHNKSATFTNVKAYAQELRHLDPWTITLNSKKVIADFYKSYREMPILRGETREEYLSYDEAIGFDNEANLIATLFHLSGMNEPDWY